MAVSGTEEAAWRSTLREVEDLFAALVDELDRSLESLPADGCSITERNHLLRARSAAGRATAMVRGLVENERR
jgi:hypothetical protein